MKFLLLLLLPALGQAQNLINPLPFPQQQVNGALQKAWEENNQVAPVSIAQNSANSSFHSGIYHLLQQGSSFTQNYQPSASRSGGILYIGAVPNDTLRVSGTWQNSGPVFVINDGVLIFDNAQANISGFLLVAGTAKIVATNSTFYFPQQYFYEWGLQAAQHGHMYMRHCTLDFAGMAHMFGVSDSATLELHNVYFSDNTTTAGLNNRATYSIDSSNLLGEIVATDSARLSITNSDTVIVWHRIARGQSLTWTFPNGVNLQHYAIGPDSPGVSGPQYRVEADNVKLLNWALMPDNNSAVNISNSTIRSVGAIFKGTDNATVQGLVDNSTYTSASNLFNDRTFSLTNCSVRTWGLYPTDTTNVNITSCITGEIGSGGVAHTSCSSMFNDGSGGYFWVNGKAFQSGSGCSFTCPVRAEQQGTMLVGFCSIAASSGYAVDSALLIMIQTPTISQPVAYGGSDVWVGMLPPQTANAGDMVALSGSAYILRGPISHLMSFASYYVAYQAPGTQTWVTIGSSTTAVNNNTLTTWNTAGLATGHYNLILVMKDNYNDSVTVNSAIDLQMPTGLPSLQNNGLRVYPNPMTDKLTISNDQMQVNKVTLTNTLGQIVFGHNCVNAEMKFILNLDVHQVPTGVYLYHISYDNGSAAEGRVVKM